MSYELHKQLWDISHSHMEKHVGFVNSLTSQMQEQAMQLRSQLFSDESKKRDSFLDDFEEAHNKLLGMIKSLESFVKEWKHLFAQQRMVEHIATAKPLPPGTFECMKPTLDYQAGQMVELFVTHIPDPSDGTFYAIDKSRKHIVQKSFMFLQESKKDPLVTVPPVGTAFILCLDDFWHRAVCNMQWSSERSVIFLLDTGKTIVYEKCIRMAKLPPELCLVPAHAMKCRTSQTSAPLQLSTRHVSCQVGEILNDTLIVEQKLAYPSGENPFYSNVSNEVSNKLTLPSTSKAALEGVQKVDDPEKKGCNNRRSEASSLGKNPFYSYTALEGVEKADDPETKGCNYPRKGILRKDTGSSSVPPPMKAPYRNAFVMLLPTCVMDLDEIYVNVVGNESSNQAFERMMAEMNTLTVFAYFKLFEQPPVLGEPVIAKYEGSWYRAMVNSLEGNKFEVFYFDYGNKATVGLDELRRWEERFQYLPCQVACCRIANIQRIKPYHEQAVEWLYKSIIDKPMKAMIVDNKNPWEILLFDENDNDIGEMLIDAKLALPRTPKKDDLHVAFPG